LAFPQGYGVINLQKKYPNPKSKFTLRDNKQHLQLSAVQSQVKHNQDQLLLHPDQTPEKAKPGDRDPRKRQKVPPKPSMEKAVIEFAPKLRAKPGCRWSA
jgi:hypothetical protein